MGFRFKIIFCLAAVLILSACSVVQLRDTESARGVYHHVKSGETLWRISQAYGVSLQDIAEANNITDPAAVTAGTVIFIPDAHRVVELPAVERKPDKKAAAPVTKDKAEAKPKKTAGASQPSKGSDTVLAKEYSPQKSKVREEELKEGKSPKRSATDRPPAKSTAQTSKPASTTSSSKPAAAPAPTAAAAKTKTETAAKEKPAPKPAGTPPTKTVEPAAKSTKETYAKTSPTLEDVRRRVREEGKQLDQEEKKKATIPSEEAKPRAQEEGKTATREEAKPKPREEVKKKAPEEEHGKIAFEKGRFVWPVRGKVTSKFGIQSNGMKNNGIRISAKEGTPVVAAAGGTIIYSAPLKYYGDTILIKHDDNFVTVYTCLKDRVVKKDDRVKKGEKLALLGKTDAEPDAPYLYFEIRQDNKARNPMFFLP